jgi:hypothetical protein
MGKNGQNCFPRQETVPRLFTVLAVPPKECTWPERTVSGEGDPFFVPVPALPLWKDENSRPTLRSRLKLDGPNH